MIGQLADNRRRDGGNVRTSQRNLSHVVWRTDRSGKDLGLVAIIVVDLTDVLDQLDPIEIDVIKTAEEGRDVGGADLGSEQCLVGREAQRDVGLDALVEEVLGGLEAGTRYVSQNSYVIKADIENLLGSLN